MFAGYGGASFALKKAGVEFENIGYSEIDKYASQCYEQNHNGKNYGDCTIINTDELSDFDLLTGGFPCQSFSVAGKGLGEQDTRGTLFNDIIRIAEAKQPKYMLLENVKGLIGKKHKDTFNKILSELKRIGYTVFYQVLNSKEHGIPQNRERVFFVCYRNDIVNAEFKFPSKEDLKIFLKDILEDDVDEKYYLNETTTKKLLMPKTSYCIDANYHKGTNLKGYLEKKRRQIIQVNNKQPFIALKNATKKGYIEAMCGDGVNLEFPDSETRRGRSLKQISGTLQCNDMKGVVINPLQISSTQKNNTITRSGINNCLPSAMGMGGGHTPMVEDFNNKNLTIRKLTPTECFRLMGFLDDGINLDGLSNTQRYKLAGNGWDINLVSKIFKNMRLTNN